MLLSVGVQNHQHRSLYVMDKTMKIKVIIALLLLIVMSAQQAFCSQYAVKIEKVIEERNIKHFRDKNLVH